MSFAQRGKKQNKGLNTKKVKVVDSIKVSKIADELPTTLVATGTKDSIIYDLKDMAMARKKDSLWLKELYKSDLFEDIHNSIVNQEFDPVEYEELPTEVLKQRLKD